MPLTGIRYLPLINRTLYPRSSFIHEQRWVIIGRELYLNHSFCDYYVFNHFLSILIIITLCKYYYFLILYQWHILEEPSHTPTQDELSHLEFFLSLSLSTLMLLLFTLKPFILFNKCFIEPNDVFPKLPRNCIQNLLNILQLFVFLLCSSSL